MANLLRYGHLQPSEAESLDEDVQIALAKRIEALRRSDEEGMLEVAKAIMQVIVRSR